jgi:hypothetical protein
MVITFRDGQAHFVVHDDLRDLLTAGEARVRRASHVTPVSRGLRWLFTALRARVADTSALAGWTRRWPCRWQADLSPVGGPVIGPFTDRQAAIAAEIDWIEEHVL